MKYPTLEAVEKADREQLCRWHRFLPSPGWSALDKAMEDFQKQVTSEAKIMDRIEERFKQMGGFNTELSKLIGWEEHH
jgi:hypothetical protein